MPRLEGRVAIVTGAANGIGRAVAERLAADGAKVAMLDWERDAMRLGADGIAAAGGVAWTAEVDLADVEETRRAIDAAVTHFGQIDILVNNAGCIDPMPMLKIDTAGWDRIFALNTRGLFFCLQHAAGRMTEQGRGGKIVNVASIGGKWGNVRQAHYGASKAAVINLTYSAALALAPARINVNAVCPGVIDTRMWVETDRAVTSAAGLPLGEEYKRAIGQIPLGRAGSVTDVAAVASFLCSRDADYLTGQTINVDGGLRQD